MRPSTHALGLAAVLLGAGALLAPAASSALTLQYCQASIGGSAAASRDADALEGPGISSDSLDGLAQDGGCAALADGVSDTANVSISATYPTGDPRHNTATASASASASYSVTVTPSVVTAALSASAANSISYANGSLAYLAASSSAGAASDFSFSVTEPTPYTLTVSPGGGTVLFDGVAVTSDQQGTLLYGGFTLRLVAVGAYSSASSSALLTLAVPEPGRGIVLLVGAGVPVLFGMLRVRV